MRVRLVLIVVVFTLCVPSLVLSGFEGRSITDNAFSPTGYTLHRGEFSIGIGPMAFGVTENVQIGTNLLLWIIQVYNVDAKVSVIKNDDRALALGLGAYRLSLDSSDDGTEHDFTAIAPYASGSLRIGSATMLHGGGRYAHFSAEENNDIEDTDANETASGTNVFIGIEQSYSDKTKFLADASYDTTFEGVGIGSAVLFGWTKFRLKLGVSYFTAGDGFVFPIIGMRWRFQG